VESLTLLEKRDSDHSPESLVAFLCLESGFLATVLVEELASCAHPPFLILKNNLIIVKLQIFHINGIL
jgi:hypothetical protein